MIADAWTWHFELIALKVFKALCSGVMGTKKILHKILIHIEYNFLQNIPLTHLYYSKSEWSAYSDCKIFLAGVDNPC